MYGQNNGTCIVIKDNDFWVFVIYGDSLQPLMSYSTRPGPSMQRAHWHMHFQYTISSLHMASVFYIVSDG